MRVKKNMWEIKPAIKPKKNIIRIHSKIIKVE
jgi:hypothetical protein